MSERNLEKIAMSNPHLRPESLDYIVDILHDELEALQNSNHELHAPEGKGSGICMRRSFFVRDNGERDSRIPRVSVDVADIVRCAAVSPKTGWSFQC